MIAEKQRPSAADVPEEWPAIVREIVQREGTTIRAGDGNTIEVQSINTGRFHKLMVPGGGQSFATTEDRDVILTLIHKGK